MKKLIKRIVMGVLTGALMFGALGTDFGTVNVEAKTKVYTLDSTSEEAYKNRYILSCMNFVPGVDESLRWAGYNDLRAGDKKIELKLSAKTLTSKTGTCVVSIFNKNKTITIPSSFKVKFPLPQGGWETRTFKTTDINSCEAKKVYIPKTVKNINSGAFGTCEYIDIKSPGRVKMGSRLFTGKQAVKREVTTQTGIYTFTCYTTGSNVKTVIVRSTKLKQSDLKKNTFKGMNKTATIKVPKKCVKKYTKMFRKAGLSKKVKVVAIE